MNICKRALTIALRHPLYLIIYIGFLSSMGVYSWERRAEAARGRPPRFPAPASYSSIATDQP